jgi:group I intron endonuclease
MRHGIEVFLFEIIETVDCIENLLEREQFYIDFLKPQYNISPVVTNPMSGRQHTEESKKKMSESHKGQVPWNTGIIGYNSGDKNPMYGKHWSEEHKKAQAKKLAGSNSPNATITEEIVLQIKLMILHGDKQKNIANFFGISEQIVSKIHTGRSWRHVTLNNTEGDKIYATPQ